MTWISVKGSDRFSPGISRYCSTEIRQSVQSWQCLLCVCSIQIYFFLFFLGRDKYLQDWKYMKCWKTLNMRRFEQQNLYKGRIKESCLSAAQHHILELSLKSNHIHQQIDSVEIELFFVQVRISGSLNKLGAVFHWFSSFSHREKSKGTNTTLYVIEGPALNWCVILSSLNYLVNTPTTLCSRVQESPRENI